MPSYQQYLAAKAIVEAWEAEHLYINLEDLYDFDEWYTEEECVKCGHTDCICDYLKATNQLN